MDSIIEAHAKYLSEITEKAFLSGQKQKALHHRVQSLFGCILKYNTILDHLHGYASTEEARRLGNHRTLDTDKLQNIRKRQKETEDDFTSKILQFLEILKSFHDEDLRSLSTRLDYNGYYSEYKK